MALLDVRNVTRRFIDSVAVGDVSFAVNAGEFFTLSARAPAGRTSRFRCGGQ
jgi:spermidine/putrescine transport system ATP-binding protein